MPNINDVYQSDNNHLKATDLPPGKQVQVTIAGYEIVEFDDDGKKSKKVVLNFQGAEKTLVVNKTNATTIAAVLGEELDTWIGKAICVYSTKVDFGGKMVDAIRVFMPRETVAMGNPQPEPQPTPQPVQEQPAAEPPEDDIPF